MNLIYIVSIFSSLFLIGINGGVIHRDTNGIDCQICRTTVNDLIAKRHAGASRQEMYTIFKKLCMQYLYGGEDYCEGLINTQLDIGLYIIDNRKNLTGARVCAIYLQYKECTDPELGNWTINIPEKLTLPSHASKRFETKKQYLQVLHLSDMHYDPTYKPGSNSKCSNILCCRNNSGEPDIPENAAGYWGSYDLCDIPWHTVEEILNRIKKSHKDIDFIYCTGDIISHTGYETSVEKNTKEIRKLYRTMKQTFGSTPVYPVLGNHEPHPADFFAPNNIKNEFSTQWLYNLTIDEWSSWIPISETEDTIHKGGFYTLLLKPGYRLIAMNNNMPYINDLWLVYEDKDPYSELQWLVDTLYEAEKNGEYVHIIGHIEPGENLVLKVWMHQYHRILRRFSHIIKAQINGHTHLDEFRLIYNESDPNQVVHYSFVGGSCTTFVGNNPDYRIYKINPETFEVDDYDQYTFNLTEANLNPKESPKWYKQYSFLEEYEMNEISQDSMDKLFKKLNANETLAYLYYKNQVRNSDLYLSKGCDSNCLKQKLCRINSIEFEDANKCLNYFNK